MIEFEWKDYVYPPDEHGMTSVSRRVLRGIHKYSIDKIPGRNDLLVFTKDGQRKVVKIEDNREFTYKAMKTKIKAIGGAEGLYEFCSDEFWDCHRRLICDHVIEKMKATT